MPTKKKTTTPIKRKAATPRKQKNNPQRRPKLLWANYYCLLDTSSGASISAREMLLQLVKAGFEVAIMGATVFDAEKGRTVLQPHLDRINQSLGKFIDIEDGILTHKTLVTQSWVRDEMCNSEISTWHATYAAVLDNWQPDMVWYYGGNAADYLIADEAKQRGIKVAGYLVNGNYHGTRWCRDMDVIITDSQATSNLYRERLGLDVKAVGTFIPLERFVAHNHERKHILYVNPSLAKGAGLVVQLALLLEKHRPDIKIEVVESRGNWQDVVERVTESNGDKRSELSNVIVTPNTSDMRTLYGRARLLLAPSLWWESGARVLAEAMLNGIPAIVTDNGGSPEMIQNGGIKLQLPKECHEAPYTTLPRIELLTPLVDKIIEFYDNEAVYNEYVGRAQHVGQIHHNINLNTQKLAQIFLDLIAGQLKAQHSKMPEPQQAVQSSPFNTEEIYKQICLRFQQFRPNSAGWTGGLKALADLTELSARQTFDGLQNLVLDSLQKEKAQRFNVDQLFDVEFNDRAKALASDLEIVFNEYGSDKSTAHNYHKMYGHVFSQLPEKNIHMLEIGMGSNNIDTPSNMGKAGKPGASLRAFRDFLQTGQVFGADVDKRILFEEECIKTHFVDQTDLNTFEQLARWLPCKLDLLIDDGLHAPNANINTLVFGLKQVKPGGWIVIEDILEPMLPIWELVSQLLPEGCESKLVKTKNAWLYVVQVG